MCELMAMSFDAPVSADFSIREFGARGEENPDGWGLGWYPDRSLAMIKQPVRWGASRLAGFLEAAGEIHARILLAHVRYKTVGDDPSHADTHPFTREWGGRDYVFAHNGTLEGPAWHLPLGNYRPVGETDSERFFCHLLGEIAGRGKPLDTPDDWNWLHETLASANRFGKLNVLLSDGHRLFIYHDVNGWKGLNFRKIRVREGHHRYFGDEEISIEISGPALNHGFVVATCPLSRAGWHSFRLGELIVFERGEIVYSSHRSPRSPEFAPMEDGMPVRATGT
ncbi:class II glutamine amidotransferase [Tundrisphaera lichenicola]|uniref:class II glutamine amidotransferase n=1 Tax=Tundrisphaera lichenicola TaxID=2029860 RepID=UPI003EBDA935